MRHIFNSLSLLTELFQSPARVVLIALTFGFAIAALVYATAHHSGGHLNPAITLAVIATRNIPLLLGLGYIAVQFAGAVLGALLIKASTPFAVQGSLGANFVAAGVSRGSAFVLEFVLTFLLVFVVFAVAIDRKADKPLGRTGYMAPLAIGLAVLIAHLMATPFTGNIALFVIQFFNNCEMLSIYYCSNFRLSLRYQYKSCPKFWASCGWR